MINACQIDLEEYLVYELTVKTNFAAAHSLRNYSGECASLHGHTWVVEVSIVGRELDDAGMLIDFKKLKQLIAKTIEELDHSYINEFYILTLTVNIAILQLRIWRDTYMKI